MTLKRKSSNAQLPRLSVPAEHEALRQVTPPDLKGIQYTHLPRVGLATSSPLDDEDDEPVILLPLLDEPHPYPYIVTADVWLTETVPPVLSIDDELEEAYQYFLIETKFSKEFFEEYLPELLEPHIHWIVKEVIGSEPSSTTKTTISITATTDPQSAVVATASVVEEEPSLAPLEKNNSEDEQEILLPITEEFDDTTDSELEEEWLWPEMDDQCRDLVWTWVDEKGRRGRPDPVVKQKGSQFSDKQKTLLFARVIGDDRNSSERRLREDELLGDVSLQVILNEYHDLVSKQKLTENSVLKQFQEEIISQTLAELVLHNSLESLEKSVVTLESRDIEKNPART